MKKNFTILLCFVVFAATAVTAQFSPGQNPDIPHQEELALINGASNDGSNPSPMMPTITCGADTIQYLLSKMSTKTNFGLDAQANPSQISQYFDAPQSIDVHGVQFYARVTGGAAVKVYVEIYTAAADSSPTGNALRLDSILVDTMGGSGNLNDMVRTVVWSSPATVSAPYCIVLRNTTTSTVQLQSSNPTQGGQEWLMSMFFQGQWFRTHSQFINYDADILLSPIVSYTLTSSFSVNNPCLSVPGTRTFTNASSAILESRMYNQEVLNNGSSVGSFTWDFGDGSATVNAKDTSHTYLSAGAYVVTLTDTIWGWTMNSCSTDTTFQFSNGPQVSFASAVSNLLVNFTDSTTGGTIISWLWDFGDGNASSTQNPSHTYGSSGTYTVCLTVVDNCGSDSSCSTINVGCAPQNAAFMASPAGLTVSFTDQTPGSPTAWAWTFGDGGTDNTQNPSHTYTAAGTYLVCLSMTDTCGTDSTCDSVTVVACNPPAASFTSTPNALTVQFNDASTTSSSIISWSWDFGDGNTSTMQNPSHTYAGPDTVTVCLTVTDSCATDSSCSTLMIDSTVSVAGTISNLDIDLYPNPNNGSFNLSWGQLNSAWMSIEVLDMTGRIVYKRHIENPVSGERVSIQGISAGSYLVRIEAEEGRSNRRLIIR